MQTGNGSGALRGKQKGYQLLGIGEMGIGDTTTSAAMAAAMLGLSADTVTGKGAGLDEQGLTHKKEVIEQALLRYGLRETDTFTILPDGRRSGYSCHGRRDHRRSCVSYADRA